MIQYNPIDYVITARITICPVCDQRLEIRKFSEKEPTRCNSCDYQELAGNADIISQFGACLGSVLKQLYVKRCKLKNIDFSLTEALYPDGLLPLIITEKLTLKSLKIVEDKNALLNSRVVLHNPDTIANDFKTLSEHLIAFVLECGEGELNDRYINLDFYQKYYSRLEDGTVIPKEVNSYITAIANGFNDWLLELSRLKLSVAH